MRVGERKEMKLLRYLEKSSERERKQGKVEKMQGNSDGSERPLPHS